MPEPVLDGDEVPRPLFGDARSVKLLGDLLNDEDLRVRERAAGELGQTHNPKALAYLKRAAKDSSPAVRAAATRGAVELGFSGKEIVLAGLNDKDITPLLAAMNGAVVLKLIDAVEPLRNLTRHEQELIRAAAPRTLTALGQTANPENLKRLLGDPSPAVRVEALSNALLLASAEDLKDDFIRLANASQPPAVRAAAIECLGKFVFFPRLAASYSFGADTDMYKNYAADANPLPRRSVVRTYRRHDMAAEILPFLADPSPLVRLSAAEALVHLPTESAVKPLVELFLAAPDEKTHTVAKEALRKIGGAPVGEAMAGAFSQSLAEFQSVDGDMKGMQKQIDPLVKTLESSSSDKKAKVDPKVEKQLEELRFQMRALQRKQQILQRNAMSCCSLLGVLRRKEGFDNLLRQATALPLDSPILGEVAVALGRIGDERAMDPLRTVLSESSKQAIPYLKAISSMATPPPFSEKVTGQVIQALAALGDAETFKTVYRLSRIRVMSMRLGTVIAYSLKVLPSITADAPPEEVEKMIMSVLMDPNLSSSSSAQWRAAKMAGVLKLQPALRPLKRILRDRETTVMMTVAAWAIQQITGEENPPNIPEPVLNQGSWIITQTAE
ncbi:MAG: HEAT repeat domain-containing protein [Phycisphaerae bacterium]|nr:HEAT repeat domain-containing protein [Phycisphaerae bacterium]